MTCTECEDGAKVHRESEKAGFTATEVPTPRHAWKDIAVCPVCKRSWLVVKKVKA